MKILNNILSLILFCLLFSLTTTACGLTDEAPKDNQNKPTDLPIEDMESDGKDDIPEKPMIQNCNLNEVQHKIAIPDFRDSTNIFYSDIFTEVKYIDLESTPNSAIFNRIFNLQITNDKDLIILDNNGKIVRFDSCGHYLNLIGEFGHGPNEYISPISIAYDKFDNLLIVLDMYLQKLLYFNMDGKKVKSQNLPFDCKEIKVLDEQHIICYANYFYTDYNYAIISKNGDICSKFEKIELKNGLKRNPITSNTLRKTDNGDMLCRAEISSIIYRVHNGVASPFIELIPKVKNWTIARPDKIQKIEEIKQPSLLVSTIIVNGKLFLEGYESASDHDIWYWTDMKGSSRGGCNIINDVNGDYTFDLYIQHKDKDIYYVIYPDKFQEIVENWKDSDNISPQKREAIQRMANRINPLIQVCTVKD